VTQAWRVRFVLGGTDTGTQGVGVRVQARKVLLRAAIVDIKVVLVESAWP